MKIFKATLKKVRMIFQIYLLILKLRSRTQHVFSVIIALFSFRQQGAVLCSQNTNLFELVVSLKQNTLN